MSNLEIFQNSEFQTLPDDKKSAVLSNYFNKEMADDEFVKLPQEKQESIRANFISKNIQNPITPKAKESDPVAVFGEDAFSKASMTRKITPPNSAEYKKWAEKNSGEIEPLITPMPFNAKTAVVAATDTALSAIDHQDQNTQKALDIKSHIDNIQFANKDLVDMVSSFRGDKESAARLQEKALLSNKALADTLYAMDIKAIVDHDGKVKFEDDKGKLQEVDDNFWNSLKNDIKNSKFELAGDVAGGAAGYKAIEKFASSIPGWRGKALKGITTALGAAAGAFAGKGIDIELSKDELLQEINTLQEASNVQKIIDENPTLDKMAEAANLSLVGSAIAYPVAKGVGKVVDTVGDVKQIPKKAWDYAKNNNIDGAVDKLKKDLQVDDAVLETSVENAKKDIKEVEQYDKGGLLSDVDKKQEQIINTLLQDKEGLGANIIKDAIKSDSVAATNLTHTIKNRADKVKSFFSDDQLRGRELVYDINNYVTKVKKNFQDMKNTFNDAFKHTGYTFDADALGLIQNMQKDITSIVDPYSKETAENLLSSTTKSIENATNGGKVLDINTLLEVRASVNHFYRLAQKNLDYNGLQVYKNIIGGIDEQVTTSIEKNLPKEMQGKMQSLFRDTMREYADMKSFADSALYREVVEKKGVSEEERASALVKNIANDDGQFTFLMQNLPPQRQAAIENGVLSSMLKKHTHDVGGVKGAVDYAKFFEDASRMSDFFTTPQAKETVSLLQDMSEKYSRDFELLADAANSASKTNTGAGIAQTWWGRVEYLIAKGGFDRLMRLMPTEAGRSKALREHVRQALQKSRTPMDFIKRNITAPDLPPSDKKALKEMIASNNALLKTNNEQQAQKLLLEIEAKEAAKAQAEAEAKAMFESFDGVDSAELLAVQKLGGYDALAQTVKNLQNPTTRTVDDVKKFVEAKAKIDPKRLESMTTNIKYPLKDADAKIEKLLQSNVLDGIVDETTLKVLRYDIKGGKLRNEAIEQKYKEVMKIYDEVSSVKPPEQLLREKQSLLNESLRKMKFEESVDDLAAAAVHRENAAKLQGEIEELQGQISSNTNTDIRTSRKLPPQAQAAKDIADMNYHNDEDEAAQAVKDLFRKNAGEEKLFKNMSDEDMAEYERSRAKDNQKPAHMSDEDWNEANMLFAKGGDNLAAGTFAGIEQDENGNITLDAEKFLLGFGGYTAVKAALKNKQVQGKLKEYAQKAIDTIDMNPQVYKENGLNAMAKGKIPAKETNQDKELADFVLASIKKHAKELEPSDSIFSYLSTTKNGKIYSPELNKELDTTRIINHFADKATISESTGELIGEGADRLKYINYMVNAVQEPLFVAKEGEKYHFFKSFLVKNPKDENKYLRYAVVTLDKDGEVLGLTSHLMKNNDVKNLLKKSDEVIGGGSYPDFVPPVHLMSGAAKEIIPQTKKEWDKNLMEWHKESHALTKNEDGTPKVFYHGTGKSFDEFKHGIMETSYRGGFYFSDSADKASAYASPLRGKNANILPVYLKIKNPYIAREGFASTPKVPELIKNGHDGLITKDGEHIVFYPAQIKSVHNKGTFDENNPNILYAKGGDNLAAGAYAGIEEDENGNLIFNPEKFILGLGGYTIAKETAKQIVKHYKLDDKLAKQIDDFAQNINEDMAKMAGGGTPPKNFIDDHGFYSVLEKTIDEKVGGKIDSVSLAKMLEKNGVKQDELEWSGLKELLEKNDKLTKEEIEDTIKSNRLEIEVVEKGSLKIRDEINKQYADGLIDYDEFTKKLKADNTKYKDWKLQGGENYRELLFRKPAKLPDDVKFIKADDGYWYAEKAPYDGTNVLSSAKNKVALEKEFNVKEFKSGHWDEGNILAFTRVDDRTIDNKKTLFAEEIQSDWHQEGRKKGYGKKGVPEAPFEKNWHEFTLKRLIQEAAANDYDKIAWTTGKQQAERYSLEKTVDMVVYNKDAGVIQATNGSKEVFFKHVASEQEIEGIMGKELTARLLDKKNTTTDSVHVLQGEELKFGGEGMQGFYDEIMPNAAKKLFKKWGVKPKMEELDDVEQMVWSVDITPQMRDDIKKYGQPLYAKEEIGAGLITGVEYDEDGNISGFDIENFLLGAVGGHALSKALKKEKRGIFNVTHNGKNSTQIKKYDLEALNDYIKYERGDDKKGAVHIQKHLEDGSQGNITDEELLKMGEIIRDMNYFIKDGKRVYEKHENGIRHRVVVGDGKKHERVISFFSNRKGVSDEE